VALNDKYPAPFDGGGLFGAFFTAKALLLPRPMYAAATNHEAFLFAWPVLSIAENDMRVNEAAQRPLTWIQSQAILGAN
jgi:hypothetical protein